MLTNIAVDLIMEDCVALNLTLDYDIEQKTQYENKHGGKLPPAFT